MQSKIRKRASVVCVHNNKILAVRLRDPVSGVINYFVPGGEIEIGETPKAACMREAFEETGYQVEAVGDAVLSEYPYTWADQLYQCSTWFYFGRLSDLEQAAVNDADYNLGSCWLDLSNLDQDFGFDAHILKAMKKLLKQAQLAF